jgi:hypothetical protein
LCGEIFLNQSSFLMAVIGHAVRHGAAEVGLGAAQPQPPHPQDVGQLLRRPPARRRSEVNFTKSFRP